MLDIVARFGNRTMKTVTFLRKNKREEKAAEKLPLAKDNSKKTKERSSEKLCLS